MNFLDDLYFRLRTKLSILALKAMAWIEDNTGSDKGMERQWENG